MNQEAVNFVKEKTEELIAAFSCSAEAKAAGVKYCDCPACAAVEAILERKVLL